MKYDLFSGKKWIVSILAAMILLGIILSSCGSDTKQDSSAIPDPSDDISSIARVDEDSKPGHADDPIDRLAGVFYIDGDTSASCVEINSDGSFTAYYASGNVEQTTAAVSSTKESIPDIFQFYIPSKNEKNIRIEIPLFGVISMRMFDCCFIKVLIEKSRLAFQRMQRWILQRRQKAVWEYRHVQASRNTRTFRQWSRA